MSKTRSLLVGAPVALTALALASCGGAQRTTTSMREAQIDRARFNQLALRLDLPLFWAEDANGNGEPDPDEVRALLFYPSTPSLDGEALDRAIARVAAESRVAAPTDPRRALVVAELDHAAPTLVETEIAALPEAHRAFVGHMLNVAGMVDRLYARQTGMDAMTSRLDASDTASASLFRRNWGPVCRGSTTEREAACSAIEGAPRQPVDVYPAAMQGQDDSFCATLEARPDAQALLGHFSVVREAETGDGLVAVPYHEAYADLMRPIAAELRAAADAMTDPNETALVAYLRAAASGFETNDWTPADEAWSRMSARNSQWYVRVGPDETYWEPCSIHAGFHLTFARINQGSLVWQDRLTPLRAEMEGSLASLVSDRYAAREVAFTLPDFIDIVVNAGDDRDAFGATIGQSLPNWGPVSDEGRGRTVAMSNLYTDADSLARRRAQASSLLGSEAMAIYSDDQTSGLLSTILHEAGHNLGPSHDYRAPSGQNDDEAFGGALASMLEELKAQSCALFFVELLRERGILTDAQAREVYLDSIVWAFGHISRGMYTPTGQRKAYSQLAAVQIGFLIDQGAITWDAAALAVDGTHTGAFTIDFARLPAAVRELMTAVMAIKATGDRAAAEALAARYVEGATVPHASIVERYQGFPQASFVYSVH
ncbi:MAG: hypothetical protein J0L92_20425 [Deltaproteobacteria bacterium]|nr:hypothetical protein [Deltaproteobacteria bacterium]